MTSNEALNKLFSEAEKNGDVKRLQNSDTLSKELLKVNKKNGRTFFLTTVILAAFSIAFIILLASGILKVRIIIFNVILFILPFSPIIALISNIKSNKKIKTANYSAFICEISEVENGIGYIKGIPKKIFVEGIQINISSNVKNINIGSKILAFIIGNDFYTVAYDDKFLAS